MRGSALPAALLCAVIAFALAGRPRRVQAIALGVFVAASLATAASFPARWTEAGFAGCWASVLIAGAGVYLPRRLPPAMLIALATIAGFCMGAVVAVGGSPADLARALPELALVVPANWLVSRNWGIALKVVTSWVIAVAVLAALLPTTGSDPGYKPDHMD